MQYALNTDAVEWLATYAGVVFLEFHMKPKTEPTLKIFNHYISTIRLGKTKNTTTIFPADCEKKDGERGLGSPSSVLSYEKTGCKRIGESKIPDPSLSLFVTYTNHRDHSGRILVTPPQGYMYFYYYR